MEKNNNKFKSSLLWIARGLKSLLPSVRFFIILAIITATRVFIYATFQPTGFDVELAIKIIYISLIVIAGGAAYIAGLGILYKIIRWAWGNKPINITLTIKKEKISDKNN